MRYVAFTWASKNGLTARRLSDRDRVIHKIFLRHSLTDFGPGNGIESPFACAPIAMESKLIRGYLKCGFDSRRERLLSKPTCFIS